MMIGKALLSGLWAHPEGCFTVRFTSALSHISSCFTVRFTFLFTTLVATRRCRCLLRSDYWWVVMPWRLAPCDLGDPGWGDPWFPHGAFVASLTFWYGLGDFVASSRFVSAAIPCRDDTMLSSLAWISPWTGTCHASVLRFCFVLLFFVFVWWVCLVLVFGFLFVLFDGDFVTAYWTVQVLYQFTLEAPQSADGHVYALN